MKQENIMDRKHRILELVQQMGLVRPRDVESEGIPREYLYRLWREGELERVARGLYALPGSQNNESILLAEVSKRTPGAVICLLSALQYHHLTTQIAHRVWIAIENKRWEPQYEYPPLEIIRMTGHSYTFGIDDYEVNRVPVRIYRPSKTVADCFKFRNRVGLDVALEALREVLRNQAATMDELWEAAKVCRVSNVMRPYLEAIV